MVTIKGKNFVRMRDKMLEVDHLDANGNPVLKTWSEEKPNANGGMDCIVHVECLQIAAKKE